jgi:hypothetical protein
MIPYNVIFILDEKAKEHIHFESNEKPVKGEIYTIQDSGGKLWDAKVTEVAKFIIRSKDTQATIEYRCKVEKHETTVPTIGFGKRI